MTEVEDGVFGQRVIHHGEGDERLGWEGWLILFGLGLGVVPAAIFFPGIGLDVPVSEIRLWSPPAPPIDPVRLAVGLAVALALVAAAVRLIIGTDWSETG